ncbi:MAG: type II CAAX endopeptidase family protein [Polyangiales bacterium]
MSTTKSPERTLRSRIPGWAAGIGAVVGAVLAFVGSAVFMLVAAILVFSDDPPSPEAMRSPEFLTSVMENYPIVAASVLGTAAALVGVPLIVAKLSRTSIKEGLGFRGAPLVTFVVAPIGILALGPTSEQLVGLMKWLLPNATFNALESIGALVNAHPAWMLWPIIALSPGISEEVFFRGLVQRAAGFGTRAIVLSAISFSLFHMDPHHVAGVLPLGFYLAWVGARTGTTLVPIVAHIVNNTAALLAAKLVDAESMADETMPIWVMPIGWVIAGACIWVIWRSTKDRARWEGPAGEADATLDPRKKGISPDWRIVRVMGAQEEVLGYVRGAVATESAEVLGRFQPGPAWDELGRFVVELDAPVGSQAHREAHEALAGFTVQDLGSGETLPRAVFRIEGDRVRFRALPVGDAAAESPAEAAPSEA